MSTATYRRVMGIVYAVSAWLWAAAAYQLANQRVVNRPLRKNFYNGMLLFPMVEHGKLCGQWKRPSSCFNQHVFALSR